MKILEKNLLILASAGSGKTYQLGNRVIGKIALEGVSPERMVALTFTRKAAGEFADSVLVKLAEGSLSKEKAARLEEDLQGEIDVPAVLQEVIRALPRLQLTTMDGFFSKIVRSFQYELGLTGGTFTLLQGEELATAESEILMGVMKDGFARRQDFYHAFRKAALGRGQQGVKLALESFLEDWHQLWKAGVRREAFGNREVFSDLPKVDDWLAQRDGLIAALRGEEHPKAWQDQLENFGNHVVGKRPQMNVLGKRFLELLDEPGPVEVKNGRGMLTVRVEDWKNWRSLFQLAAGCEVASAVAKTEAIGDLVAELDQEHSRQLRRRGLLSFDDVKILLGRWSQDEEARVRRELIDYRIDGQYDHWLLDEFQDTSRIEWLGLKPLIEETVTKEEGSLFIVGDRKQGIYAWRGGEVTLFDQVLEEAPGAFEVATLERSYRSCPAVLAVVNAVCGNLGVIEKLFGKAVRERWHWKDHLSAKAEVSGEGKVSFVGKGEAGAEMISQLRELGIGRKKLSCGVLVRKRDQVRAYAELLREAGFEVIEAGERSPGTDHAVGVALTHLITWLADPADRYAREVVEMSPLFATLEKYGQDWGSRWDAVLLDVQEFGWSRFTTRLLDRYWASLKSYGRRRADDLIAALAEFDASGESSPRAAASWIQNLQVAQAPGVAAIQVMTIHKSKGLGFDVVMLPEIQDKRQEPDAGRFSVAQGKDWVLQVPGNWTFGQHPELAAAYERWEEAQLYEGLCLLYVALTRAKRGLYLYLEEEPASRKNKESFRTTANLVRQTTGIDFAEAEANWAEWVEDLGQKKEEEVVALGKAVPLRGRSQPSTRKPKTSGGGRRLGTEVHRLFEAIEWLEEGEEVRPEYSAAGLVVEEAMRVPKIRAIFAKRQAMVFREQAFEVIEDGRWMSCLVDRVHRYPDGRVEIYDFKCDAVKDEAELWKDYREQLVAYRRVVAKAFKVEAEAVRCYLVSTKLGEVFEMEEKFEQGELGL